MHTPPALLNFVAPSPPCGPPSGGVYVFYGLEQPAADERAAGQLDRACQEASPACDSACVPVVAAVSAVASDMDV
eukprot:6201217-Pleurochrysis_carterae.AAC.1